MAVGIGTIITALSTVAFDTGTRDDDTVDRLNHMVMYGLLICIAFVTGSRQFVGSPINCWIPAQYTEKFQKSYANNHCWINSLYSIPFEETIPVEREKRYVNDVAFYRYVTIMFIVLASLFRVPQLLWKELKHTSGVNVEKLVGMTTETAFLDHDKKDEKLNHVAEFFHRWVTTRQRFDRHGRFQFLKQTASNFFFCYGKRSGHNLVITYLFIKSLYLLNTVGQFFILSSFLRTNFWDFGSEFMRSYLQYGEWDNEDVFPRIALCDMTIRQMQNAQTYTVQCVLTVNLFLEKMFLVYWLCLWCMLLANGISLIRWTFQLLSEAQTTEFFMSFSGYFLPELSTSKQERKMFMTMVKNYLKPDGVFVLRLISINTTDLLTVDLIRQIWSRYKKFKKLMDSLKRIEASNSL